MDVVSFDDMEESDMTPFSEAALQDMWNRVDDVYRRSQEVLAKAQQAQEQERRKYE